MTDWLTDLRFWCQTNAVRLHLRCNVADEDQINAAASAAGITDVIEVEAWYVPPPGYAFVMNADSDEIDGEIDTAVPAELFTALGVQKYI